MKIENDIYMGLDKDFVRGVVHIAQLNEKEGFSVLPLPIKVIRENGMVKLEGELIDGKTIPVGMSEEQEEFLKECSEPFISAVLVKIEEGYTVYMGMGELDEEEEVSEHIADEVVESFIEYKGFKTKEELEDYLHNAMENTFGDLYESIDVNKLDIEERKRIGVDFLFGRAVCPVCSGEQIMNINDASVDGINSYFYGCIDCRNVYCVITDEYNTVTDFGMIESSSKNTNQKKKKKKKKKTKKTFGKRKK